MVWQFTDVIARGGACAGVRGACAGSGLGFGIQLEHFVIELQLTYLIVDDAEVVRRFCKKRSGNQTGRLRSRS